MCSMGLSVTVVFFFSSRRRHTRFDCDWSSDVCSSDLSGARVFSSGAQMFSWALDDWRSDGTIAPIVAVGSDRAAPVDPRVQQFMRNALADLQRPPPPSGLAVQSTAGRLVVSIAAPLDPRPRAF